MKAQGKCTTDHISAAGPWLKYRGHLENISGNLFLGVVNAFTGATGEGKDATDGETRSFPDIAKHYSEEGVRWCAVGDQNYGEGSSREHAAMEPRFRNGMVIFARSFARIHETNLKKQGLVPLTFADPATYDQIGEDDRINVLGLPPVPGRARPLPDREAGRHDDRLRGRPHLQRRAGRVVQGRLGPEHRPPEGRRRRGLTDLPFLTLLAPAERERVSGEPARLVESPSVETISTLRTTGAARTFTDEAIPDDVVHQILDDARFAPSGGNRQPWRVAVVEDVTVRRRLADLMQPVWDATSPGRTASRRTTASTTVSRRSIRARRQPLLDDIDAVPVVLVVAADLRRIAIMDGNLERPPLTGGASIYPFCWSILLSAHGTRTGRRDHHVPLARRAGRGAAARPARA